MNINVDQITGKISKLPINQIAIQSGFRKRKAKKIEALGFVVGFFMMLQQSGNSLSDWVRAISRYMGKLISKQALEKKLQFRQEAFAYQLLSAAIKQSLQDSQAMGSTDLFDSFHKVYLEDSSCLKLPAGLAPFSLGRTPIRGHVLRPKFSFDSTC